MSMKLREEGDHAVTRINGREVYMEDVIMEMELGRPLYDNETVFHRNSNTLDNRRSNLYVVLFGIDFAQEGEDRTVTQ